MRGGEGARTLSPHGLWAAFLVGPVLGACHSPPADADGDGFASGVDCDDADAAVHPDAPDLCQTALAEDCGAAGPACRWTGSQDIEAVAQSVTHEDPSSAFGGAILDLGDQLAVGAPGGAGAVYALDPAAPSLEPGLAWSVRGGGTDALGSALAPWEGGIAVGAPGAGEIDPAPESTGLAAGAVLLLPWGAAPGSQAGDVATRRWDGDLAPACLGASLAAVADHSLLLGAPCLGAAMIHHEGVPLPILQTGRGAAFLLPSEAPSGPVASVADGDWEGDSDWARLGTSLTVGDWDGDGAADLALGAPDRYIGDWLQASATGRVHLWSGPEFATHAVVTGTCCGRGRYDELGGSISAGDADGDGLDDVLAGSPGLADFERQGGAFLLPAPFQDERPAWEGDARSFAGAPQAALDARSGASVLLADIDCDGQQDAAIAAPWTDRDGATQAGAVAIVYGPFDGWEDLREPDLLLRGRVPWSNLGAAMAASSGESCGRLWIGAPGAATLWGLWSRG